MRASIRLSELLNGLATVPAGNDRMISGLALDSRRVGAGELFCALPGTRAHGAVYIEQAVAGGAGAVLIDVGVGGPGADWYRRHAAHAGVPVIGMAELPRVLGVIADRYYGRPSAAMTVIGVTGTNGKTSCTQFLAQALESEGPSGVIGTLGNGLVGELAPATHTTPDAVSLQALLAALRDRGARSVAMEVSSHGLDQGRVNGVVFEGAVFTNLSRDHLDYHGDMAAYGQAKRRLFDQPGLRWAAINGDDAFGREILHSLPPGLEIAAYGLEPVEGWRGAAVIGSDLTLSRAGLRLTVRSPWGEGVIESALVGRFNASNVLAVLTALLLHGCPFEEALQRLAALRPVPGRMERYGGTDAQPLVVVDYAHTPDALEQVLKVLREQCAGVLWCVFGCGGERDRGKRPLMGAVAIRYAGRVLVTDDNPRGEDGEQIVAEILAGCGASAKVLVMRDRAAAIAAAIGGAAANDVVLVAGKGHEDYQLVGAERRPFSDSAEVERALARREAAR